jgi:hypothetical protein
MVSSLNKEQAAALNDIAMKAAILPSLAQILLIFLLLFPLMFLFSGAEAHERTSIMVALSAALITVFVAWIVARYVVPKSLFKPRKKGALVVGSMQSFHAYVRRWIVSCVLVQCAVGVIFIVLGYVGITLPNISAVVVFAATYTANYLVAQRMLAEGHATLKLKSQE